MLNDFFNGLQLIPSKKDLAPAANHALSHILAMDVTFILFCNAHGFIALQNSNMSKTNTLEKYFFLTWQVTTTSQCLYALHISSSKYVKESLNDLQLLILSEKLMIM